jgi:hypothetical protein
MQAHSSEAFLIEGTVFSASSSIHEQQAQNKLFEQAAEIKWGADLAAINQASLFDSISIGNGRAWRQLYLDADKIDSQSSQPNKLAQVVFGMGVYWGPGLPLNQFIGALQTPYNVLISQGKINAMPAWLRELKITDFKKLPHKFKFNIAIVADITARYLKLANELAKDHFCEFLRENPSINTVYGLIGERHIAFLNEEIIEEKSENPIAQRSFKFKIDSDRTVDIHLFGGMHSNPVARQQLSSLVLSHNLQVPSEELKGAHQTAHTSIFWGYAAEFYCEVMDCYQRDSINFSLVLLLERSFSLQISSSRYQALLVESVFAETPLSILKELRPLIVEKIKSSTFLDEEATLTYIERLKTKMENLDSLYSEEAEKAIREASVLAKALKFFGERQAHDYQDPTKERNQKAMDVLSDIIDLVTELQLFVTREQALDAALTHHGLVDKSKPESNPFMLIKRYAGFFDEKSSAPVPVLEPSSSSTNQPSL